MNTIIGGMPIGTRNGYRFFAHETFERTVGKRVLDYQIYSLRKAGSPCSYVFANEVESGLPEYSLDETLALGSFDNDDIDTDIIAMAGSYAAECIDFFQGTSPDENIGRQIEAFSAGQPDAKAKRACFGALSSFLRGEGFRVLRLVEGESLYREVIFLQHKVYEE